MEGTSMHQDQSPIEQVRLTVPTTDDPTLPTLTFRVWIIGITGCIIMSLVSVLTGFRQNPVDIPDFAVTILCYSLGKLMARVLPANYMRVPGTRIKLSLNPSPFNMKEHLLSTMIFSSGSGTPPATNILAATRAYFRISIHPMAFFLLLVTTNNIALGFSGFFIKFFVTRSEMWWPEVLSNVTLFRTFHEKDDKSNAGLQESIFFMVFVISFSYYIVPGYFFPSISALSFVCLIWKSSIIAQQLGSGSNGFGIGSFGLDWSTATSFTGSPIYYPFFAIANTMVGFILFMYIVVPFAYWTNSFKAKNFPIISSEVYDVYGGRYNMSRVLDGSNFRFKQEGYESYSLLYLSITRACSIGFEFAALAASLTNIVLSHARSFWNQLNQSIEWRDNNSDVHVQMMNKYKRIPLWWFILLTLSMIGLAVFTCEGFGNELQLPYWGVILAFFLVLLLVPPLATLRATVCQEPSVRLFAHIVIGYLYPGRPLANMVFYLYSALCIESTLGILSAFKLGVYMKIPPREMFLALVIGSFVATSSDFAVTWWLFSTVKDLCRPELLPRGSPWVCPHSKILYNDMDVWGLIGPKRMFVTGVYSKLTCLFLIGLIASIPVWILARRFPEKKWIKLILVPVLFMPGAHMLPARAINYLSWFVVGFIFNYIIFRRRKEWWGKYSILFSVAMDTGTAAMAFLMMVLLQMRGINGISWWGSAVSDHCPLATRPTEPGVQVEGCPLLH